MRDPEAERVAYEEWRKELREARRKQLWKLWVVLGVVAGLALVIGGALYYEQEASNHTCDIGPCVKRAVPR